MQKFAKTRTAMAMVAALIGGGLMVGCGTSVPTGGNESAEALKPTGTIQGVIKDSSTGAPIKGVEVDIGVASAKTNSNGVFTLEDVPATESVEINNGTQITGNYTASINFDDADGDYPKYMTTTFAVQFTSLEDASLDQSSAAGGGGGESVSSNHDTPVVGLGASVGTMTVGQLNTTLNGAILVKETNAAVAEVYTVQLKNAANEIVQTVDSDATGVFSFTEVEAAANHTITVFNADYSMSGTTGTFTTATDNGITTLGVGGQENPVLVVGTDAANPYIYNIAINDGTTDFENKADIGAATSATVTFTFSEAMKADGYAVGVVPTSGTELYDHVTANFDGNKAGNIAHSMAWNTDMTALTVTIPSLAASSLYSVTIDGTNNTLMDDNDQGLDESISQGFVTPDVVASFSTGGGATVAAPTVSITNANTLDVGSNVNLDWTWGSGAASYNVYRTTTTGGVVTGAMDLVSNVTVSDATDAAKAFVSGELAETYAYVVKGVNSDGVEGAGSTAVTAADVIGPADPTAACAGSVVTLTFAEDVAEAAAEAASYTLGGADAGLTVDSVVASGTTVDLNLSGACTGGADVTVPAAVTDIAGNKLNATPASTAGAASAALVY
jgi:hypothetical protein